MLGGGGAQRSGATRRGHDLVAAHRQVDPQRAQDLRLVVDHQDRGHDGETAGAAASSTSTVRPPPGVSVAWIDPPIASMKPLATERPRPTPMVLSWSPSR